MLKAFGAEWTRVRKSLVVLLFFGAFVVFGFFFFLLFGNGRSGGEAFVRGLGEGVVPMVVGIFFPGMYVGLLFDHQGMSQDVMWGRSRLVVFIMRLLEIYLLSCLMCAPFSLANLGFFSVQWVAALDGAGRLRLLYCILMSMLLNMRCMGAGIVLGFALRDFFRPPLILLGSLIAVVLLSNIFSMILGPECLPIRILNTVLSVVFGTLLNDEMWDAMRFFRATDMDLLRTALGTLAFVLVRGGLAYLFFRRAELQ